MSNEPITTLRPQFVELMPEKEKLESGVLYISRQYQLSIHLCACGCGGQAVLPLGGEWLLTENGDLMTIRPSILNRWCKAHYYITDNRVEMLP